MVGPRAVATLLKVEKLGPPATPTIEVSEGPILWARFEGLETDRTLYWRATPSDRSLLEVGLLAWSGLLASVTLVGLDRERIRVVEALDLVGPGKENLPIFAKGFWPPDTQRMTESVDERLLFVDEPVLLDLAISPSGLSLLLNGPCVITEVLSFDRLRLGLDAARDLRRVDVVELTPQELRAVRALTNDAGGLPPQRVP